MLLIVPEKGKSKRYIVISKILAISVLIGVIALALWGIYLITEKSNPLGAIPLIAAGIISLAQIIAGIVLFKKHH